MIQNAIQSHVSLQIRPLFLLKRVTNPERVAEVQWLDFFSNLQKSPPLSFCICQRKLYDSANSLPSTRCFSIVLNVTGGEGGVRDTVQFCTSHPENGRSRQCRYPGWFGRVVIRVRSSPWNSNAVNCCECWTTSDLAIVRTGSSLVWRALSSISVLGNVHFQKISSTTFKENRRFKRCHDHAIEAEYEKIVRKNLGLSTLLLSLVHIAGTL